MRLSLRPGNPAEWLALRAGLVPAPAAEAWGGMALSGVLAAAARSGMLAALAGPPSTAGELASGLRLDPVPAGMLLDCLRAAGHVTERGGRYRLSRRSRRWLDPGSPLSVTGFIAGTADYWGWWAGLEETARHGRPAGHHGLPPDDPYWRRYVTGQPDLARLCAGEVARRLPLPAGARTLLDIGGGHGWYAAQLCRRHPGLTATVLDLPGSARVGREIIAAAGMSGRVAHRDGDATRDDLGTGYDAVLCFNLVHHLAPEQAAALLARARRALAPGGVLAVLDGFAEPGRRAPAAAAVLSLFVYLSSGSAVRSPSQLRGWLREAGFGPPREIRMRRIPGQSLYVTRAPGGRPRPGR
jgi:SAM-dependent methyltransferase